MTLRIPAEAEVTTRRGEYRGRIRRWQNPLSGAVEVDFVQTQAYGRTIRSFPSESRLAAWLSQRRWQRSEWSQPSDHAEFEL